MGPLVTAGGVSLDERGRVCPALGAATPGYRSRELSTGPLPAPSPHRPPLHPYGFRPPQLLLPGLVELSDDLLRLLGSRQSRARSARGAGSGQRPVCQAKGRQVAGPAGPSTPIPRSIQAARSLKRQGEGLRAKTCKGRVSLLWTHTENREKGRINPEGETNTQGDADTGSEARMPLDHG